MSQATHAHQWTFERIGGFDQVKLITDADWQNVSRLDTKLWAVLSCPSQQLSLDEKTIKRLDKDADNRIRVNELTQAIQFVCEAIDSPSLLLRREASLPTNVFRKDTALGQSLYSLTASMLQNAEDKNRITLEQVELAMTLFSQQAFNGDGVITRDALDSEVLNLAFKEVISCAGSREDLSGKQGLDTDLLDVFVSSVDDRLAWLGLAEETEVLLLGDATIDAIAVFEAVEDKINDYFARCALVNFDQQAQIALNPSLATYENMYANTLNKETSDIRLLPLAQVNADERLSLVQGINPAWQGLMQAFRVKLVMPLLGECDHLSVASWNELSTKLRATREWLGQEQGVLVTGLSRARLLEWQQNSWSDQLKALIAQDMAVFHQLTELDQLLSLLLFMRDLDALVQNSISMRDFYSPQHRGIFEAGELYIDGRSMRLCLTVDDIAKHATMAHRSGTFLLYCDCVKRNGTDKMSIVSAVTAGDADQLMVGRHGVFYDQQSEEWDAVVVRMIENPISVSEAFWSPYKRLGRMVATQLEKLASAREKEVEAKSAAALQKTADTAKMPEAKATTAAPFDIAKFAGIFAAMGLAIGALGTALATIVTGFLLLPFWQMPLVLVGIVLLISGPSMALAWFKLRKRNLGPILDANGWAVNTHASISIPFGATLTRVARLPSGAKRSLIDPFAPKSRAGWWLLLLAVLLVGLGWWQWQLMSSVAQTAQEVAHQEIKEAAKVVPTSVAP
ncbi:MAG: hypothetical protein KAZ85_03275 [Gammaproteobacteria bacterium]|nr:hypothetical protein [Gammaproteobacteria bacterium]